MTNDNGEQPREKVETFLKKDAKKKGSDDAPGGIVIGLVAAAVGVAFNFNDPRFSIAVEYERMSDCVGTSTHYWEKAALCACALEQAQENGWLPDYDNNGDYRDDKKDFNDSFSRHFKKLSSNPAECPYLSEDEGESRSAYNAHSKGRFSRLKEYHLMNACPSQSIRECACAVSETAKDKNGGEREVRQNLRRCQ